LRRDFAGARDFLQRSIALDPNFAPTRAVLARLMLTEALYVGGAPITTSISRAETEARIAIDLDPDLAFAHAVLAWVFTLRNDFASSLEEAETAIALNPNEPWGFLDKGRALIFSGRPADAHELLAMAERLDPRGPTAPCAMHLRALASYLEGDYLAAEAMARRAVRAWPTFEGTYPVLAAALGQLGRTDEARAARDAAKATSAWHFNMITRSPAPYCGADDERLLEGLRKAGWPTD
jgi:adenylate cyclase